MTLAEYRKIRLPVLREIRTFRRKYLFILVAILLACLWISTKVLRHAPDVWFIIPSAITLALIGERYTDAERPAVRLLQFVGCLSALYSLLFYPLMPIGPQVPYAAVSYTFLVAGWLLSLVCGAACFRIPSLAVMPSAFLVWSKLFATHVTGLPYKFLLDVFPLADTSVCIGAGLLIIRAFRLLSKPKLSTLLHKTKEGNVSPEVDFAHLLVILAIAVHLANYFWSFVQKVLIGGREFAWVTENNPAYIFLTALQDKQLVFLANDRLVDIVFRGLNDYFPFSNILVFSAQCAAISAFFVPRIVLLVILFAYDVMHLGIIVALGANFWPWIILNILIGIVVAWYDFNKVTLVHRVVGTAFILCAPLFVSTARLGWFDTGANNYVSIEAVDTSGQRHLVSTNFYTFYSSPIAHFNYGFPDAAHGFVTGTPHGGGDYKALLIAGRTCDVLSLLPKNGEDVQELDPRLLMFIRNYHSLAIAIQDHFGEFPYDYYPHHLYVPAVAGADFGRMDKRLVTAYVVKRVSACLSFVDGQLHEKVISVAEQRVDVR